MKKGQAEQIIRILDNNIKLINQIDPDGKMREQIKRDWEDHVIEVETRSYRTMMFMRTVFGY